MSRLSQGSGLSNIHMLSDARTRSISPENPSGEPGGGGRATTGTGAAAAVHLGVGWKVSPSIAIDSTETATLAAINSPGTIRHIWITTKSDQWRSLILRCYWDGCDEPAVEVPLGDFFCHGWGQFAQVSSMPIAANPYGGFNSYWPMAFTSGARVTLVNLGESTATVYFQVTYDEDEIGATSYFHAQWGRSKPLERGAVHPILHGVTGRGHFVGTYLAWGSNTTGWWGEGEVKFYIDDDDDFPTICGTGTEDYIGGAWDFEIPGEGYAEFTAPYSGLPQVIRPDGLYQSQQRFGMYRWHILDPIRFASALRVTVQALGWRSNGTYAQLSDDIASTALFYLDAPMAHREPLPDLTVLEVG